jgi:hypothetical protein
MPRLVKIGCHMVVDCLIFQFKNQKMKISKSLLGAIVIGIAVQTTTSCTKDKEPNDAKAKLEAKKIKEKNNPYSPENCPACGMG